MPSLEDLPNELLLEVVPRLPPYDLARLCLVTRRLRAIAEPFLYKSPGMEPTDGSLTHFVRTILKRPELGKHVRDLTIDWYDVGWEDEGVDPVEKAEYERLCTNTAETLGLLLGMGSRDAQIVLLLHYVPNLESLNLTPPRPDNILDRYLGTVATFPPSNAPLPAGLKSAREIEYVHYDTEGGIDPDRLLPFFTLPSVTQLRAHMVDGDQGPSTDISAYYGKSTITHLEFSYSNIPGPVLSDLLQIPRHLTHFYYEDGGAVVGYWALGIESFRAALEHVKPTLQYLKLIFTNAFEIDHHAPRETLGSLRDWPALRTVFCEPAVLLGRPGGAKGRLAELLPKGVREFTTWSADWWDDRAITQEVTELVKRKEECGLVELRVVAVSDARRGGKEELRKACEDVGVELRDKWDGW